MSLVRFSSTRSIAFAQTHNATIRITSAERKISPQNGTALPCVSPALEAYDANRQSCETKQQKDVMSTNCRKRKAASSKNVQTARAYSHEATNFQNANIAN